MSIRINGQLVANTITASQAANASMPSSSYEEITLSTSGQYFTAPYAGTLVVNVSSTTTGAALFVAIGEHRNVSWNSTANAQWLSSWANLAKGESVVINYSNATVQRARFYKALGEV